MCVRVNLFLGGGFEGMAVRVLVAYVWFLGRRGVGLCVAQLRDSMRWGGGGKEAIDTFFFFSLSRACIFYVPSSYRTAAA